MIEIKNVTLGYGVKHHKKILNNVWAQMKKGELLCILGPNGIGKTTLFKGILGLLPLLEGEITIHGTSIKNQSKVEIAKYIGYVPQYHTPPFPYGVLDVVLMGRNPHISTFGSPTKEDNKIAQESLDRLGIRHLEGERYTELSGGERQMVLIARALAQKTEYLLMDEPTSNLDYGNQIHLLKIMKRLTEDGMGICFTSHYPEHSFLSQSEVLIMKKDKTMVQGSAQELITEEMLYEMYQLKTEIISTNDRNGNQVKSIVPYMGGDAI